MNTLPRIAGTFQTEAKTCAKREKALTEIEEKRVNYSFMTYAVIMVGFLKLKSDH